MSDLSTYIPTYGGVTDWVPSLLQGLEEVYLLHQLLMLALIPVYFILRQVLINYSTHLLRQYSFDTLTTVIKGWVNNAFDR